MSYNKGHLLINVQQLMQKEADEEEWKKEKKEKTGKRKEKMPPLIN